jgi:hypothetical protein
MYIGEINTKILFLAMEENCMLSKIIKVYPKLKVRPKNIKEEIRV